MALLRRSLYYLREAKGEVMRKPPSERLSEYWLRSLHVRDHWQEVQDLELELLRRILGKLETLSEPFKDRGEMLEMYRLLLLLEVSKQRASLQQAAAEQASTEEVKSSVDWARLLPLLLAAGVVLGVIIAELLGLDMRRVL